MPSSAFNNQNRDYELRRRSLSVSIELCVYFYTYIAFRYILYIVYCCKVYHNVKKEPALYFVAFNLLTLQHTKYIYERTRFNIKLINDYWLLYIRPRPSNRHLDSNSIWYEMARENKVRFPILVYSYLWWILRARTQSFFSVLARFILMA